MVRKASAEEYLQGPYTYILVPDDTGGYAAELLEFAGCFAEGETANAAMEALNYAAAAWIRAARAQGQTIPPPLSTHGYSGKIALRLPKSLHRAAARYAERNGVSLNKYLVALIAAGIGTQCCNESHALTVNAVAAHRLISESPEEEKKTPRRRRRRREGDPP